MHYRPSHPTQRRICGAMVLVWLFALLISTAHACVVSEPSQPDGLHGSMVTRMVTHMEPAGPAHHDDALASCHKFCKEQSATLTKNKNLDNLDFALAMVAHGSPALPAAPPALPAQRLQERPQAHGPPLVIRFLRLTL